MRYGRTKKKKKKKKGSSDPERSVCWNVGMHANLSQVRKDHRDTGVASDLGMGERGGGLTGLAIIGLAVQVYISI